MAINIRSLCFNCLSLSFYTCYEDLLCDYGAIIVAKVANVSGELCNHISTRVYTQICKCEAESLNVHWNLWIDSNLQMCVQNPFVCNEMSRKNLQICIESCKHVKISKCVDKSVNM